jgi:2-polyprenyl-6-hydroxyphenyl methylase/3-demethylubiquinone-9 3-methyltransferase
MPDATSPSMRFGWSNVEPTESHSYLVPAVLGVLRRKLPRPGHSKVIDIGCGNGAFTKQLRELGFDVLGVEPAADGVAMARSGDPELRVIQASAYDDLRGQFGVFDAVVCLEVFEHLYSPRLAMNRVAALLGPSGFLIISTPYHGYVKNVALSLAGKWDFHHHPLVEHGHIKFWSRATLEELIRSSALCPLEFQRLGRFPTVAKSMMIVAGKRA